jgi:hypothetical protein
VDVPQLRVNVIFFWPHDADFIALHQHVRDSLDWDGTTVLDVVV